MPIGLFRIMDFTYPPPPPPPLPRGYKFFCYMWKSSQMNFFYHFLTHFYTPGKKKNLNCTVRTHRYPNGQSDHRKTE